MRCASGPTGSHHCARSLVCLAWRWPSCWAYRTSPCTTGRLVSPSLGQLSWLRLPLRANLARKRPPPNWHSCNCSMYACLGAEHTAFRFTVMRREPSKPSQPPVQAPSVSSKPQQGASRPISISWHRNRPCLCVSSDCLQQPLSSRHYRL